MKKATEKQLGYIEYILFGSLTGPASLKKHIKSNIKNIDGVDVDYGPSDFMDFLEKNIDTKQAHTLIQIILDEDENLFVNFLKEIGYYN